MRGTAHSTSGWDLFPFTEFFTLESLLERVKTTPVFVTYYRDTRYQPGNTCSKENVSDIFHKICLKEKCVADIDH